MEMQVVRYHNTPRIAHHLKKEIGTKDVDMFGKTNQSNKVQIDRYIHGAIRKCGPKSGTASFEALVTGGSQLNPQETTARSTR